jgi:hypothetical protein
MNIKRLLVSLLLAIAVSGVCELAFSEEEGMAQKFFKAFASKDGKEMKTLVKKHKDEVTDEVKGIVEYAMSGEVETDEGIFLLEAARAMAAIYKEEFKDERLLKAVEANIKAAQKGSEKKPSSNASAVPADKIKDEFLKLGKGEWMVTMMRLDDANDIKIEITLKEKEGGGSFSERHVSFADGNKAKEIVLKHIPNAKGRIDWISSGMGMKVVLLE